LGPGSFGVDQRAELDRAASANDRAPVDEVGRRDEDAETSASGGIAKNSTLMCATVECLPELDEIKVQDSRISQEVVGLMARVVSE
jgi:hypothetical protein